MAKIIPYMTGSWTSMPSVFIKLKDINIFHFQCRVSLRRHAPFGAPAAIYFYFLCTCSSALWKRINCNAEWVIDHFMLCCDYEYKVCICIVHVCVFICKIWNIKMLIAIFFQPPAAVKCFPIEIFSSVRVLCGLICSLKYWEIVTLFVN